MATGRDSASDGTHVIINFHCTGISPELASHLGHTFVIERCGPVSAAYDRNARVFLISSSVSW
jgi:hypothetical protein